MMPSFNSPEFLQTLETLYHARKDELKKEHANQIRDKIVDEIEYLLKIRSEDIKRDLLINTKTMKDKSDLSTIAYSYYRRVWTRTLAERECQIFTARLLCNEAEFWAAEDKADRTMWAEYYMPNNFNGNNCYNVLKNTDALVRISARFGKNFWFKNGTLGVVKTTANFVIRQECIYVHYYPDGIPSYLQAEVDALSRPPFLEPVSRAARFGICLDCDRDDGGCYCQCPGCGGYAKSCICGNA